MVLRPSFVNPDSGEKLQSKLSLKRIKKSKMRSALSSFESALLINKSQRYFYSSDWKLYIAVEALSSDDGALKSISLSNELPGLSKHANHRRTITCLTYNHHTKRKAYNLAMFFMTP